MTLPSPTLKDPSRFTYAILAASGIFLANLAVILFIPDERLRLVITDWFYPVVNLLVTAALLYAARTSYPYSKRLALAWGVFALAQLSFSLGDTSWAILETVLNEQPFPSVADGFFLGYYPLFLVGVLVLPSRRFTRGEWFEKFLDISIVMLAAALGLWNYLLGPLAFAGGDETWLSRILTLAYPVGDLVLFWALLLLVYGRSEERNRGPLFFIMAAVVMMIVTDYIFSYQSLMETYISGGLLDIGWMATYLLTGLAGLRQATEVRKRESDSPVPGSSLSQGRISSLLSYFPYAWIILAFLLLVLSVSETLPMSFSTLAWWVGVLIGLVLVRQVVALGLNARLYRQLHQIMERVQQQSAVLEDTNQELKNEIAERQRAEERLSHDALHDALTGLPNRVLFLDRLGRSIETMKRRQDFPFSVLFLDIDHFKVINDSLGHTCGDEMLVQIAQRIRMCLRSTDTVARLGGDEFVILLEDTHGIEAIKNVATRIQEELKLPFNLQGHRVFISGSIGIVPSVAGYERSEDVLRDADIAMYQAKALGKARFELFDTSLRTLAISRLELENDLRHALEHDEFLLNYQPIVSLTRNQITGFEALLRWNHPKRGLIGPTEFIPIAEETGLILSIGKWVLMESCAQIKRWQGRYPQTPPLSINVNVSGKQFTQSDFVEQIEHALLITGLAPKCLCLEITETVLINNAEAASIVFDRLRDLGVQVQIDDFGTGYSSLGYLQHYPVHTIKIDRSFISEIGVSTRNTDLVRTMVMMARDLGMEATAEGVETDDQLLELKKFGCEYGQGYLLSVPLDSRQADAFLDERRAHPIPPPTPPGSASSPASGPVRLDPSPYLSLL